MTDRIEGARLGTLRRDAGVYRATTGRRHLLLLDELAFVEALLRNPTGASTDDAVTDLAQTFDDGGRWRGSIPLGLAREKIIHRVGWVQSCRPSRHRGTVSLWAASDISKVERRCLELRAMLTALDNIQKETGEAAGTASPVLENESPSTSTTKGNESNG